MFRNNYKKKYLSIFYSCGRHPLKLWDSQVQNGFMRRLTDCDINSLVLEISSINVSTTYIYTPKCPTESLGIDFPFLIMIVKNMRRYFTFEITVLDSKQMHRRLRISNFQKLLKISPSETTIPMCLKGGWVQIQLNLADLIRRAYGSSYVETTRMKVNANCRLRQIFFSDRLYSPEELPNEFKLFVPPSKCVRAADQKSQGKVSKTSQDQLSTTQKAPTDASKQELVGQSLSQQASLAEVVEEHPKVDIHVPTALHNDEESDEQSDCDSENDENLIDKGVKSEERSQANFDYKGEGTQHEEKDEEEENEEDDEEELEKIHELYKEYNIQQSY